MTEDCHAIESGRGKAISEAKVHSIYIRTGLVYTSLWAVWAKQQAPYIRFLTQTSQEGFECMYH
jgi:hypothetical protein